MSKNIKQLLISMQEIQLSDTERDTMRRELFAYSSNQTEPRALYLFVQQLFTQRRVAYAVASVFLLIFVFGGVVSASTHALPGDPLYSVKVYITEPVYVALADSPSERMRRETNLITRRFVEAETLLVTDTLTTNASKQIQTLLEAHLEDLDTEVEVLETKRSDDALRTTQHLSTVLSFHERVLSALDGEQAHSLQKLATERARFAIEAGVTSEVSYNKASVATENEVAQEARTLTTTNVESEEDMRSTDRAVERAIQQSLDKAIKELESVVASPEVSGLHEVELYGQAIDYLTAAEQAIQERNTTQSTKNIEQAFEIIDTLKAYNELPNIVRDRIHTTTFFDNNHSSSSVKGTSFFQDNNNAKDKTPVPTSVVR